MMAIWRWVGGLFIVFALLVLAGCSTSGSSSGLRVTPSTVTLAPSESMTFTSGEAVTWSVRETGGGEITSSGRYTAPHSFGTFHVVATSVAQPGATAAARVTVSAPTTALTASPLADAVVQGYPSGANLIRWPSMGGRVLAFILYRDDNPQAPIAVLEGYTTQYLDSATPLPAPARMESTEVEVRLDASTGLLEAFDHVTSYDSSLADLRNADEQAERQTYSVTSRRVPPVAGQAYGYQVKLLFVEYDLGNISDPLQHPDEYRLYVGQRGGITPRILLTTPPTLQAPSDGEVPLNGVFRCWRVPGALHYALQTSADPSFAPADTQTVTAQVDASGASAVVASAELWQRYGSGRLVYWRMGARVDGQWPPQALGNLNDANRVYSPVRTFHMPDTPPPF